MLAFVRRGVALALAFSVFCGFGPSPDQVRVQLAAAPGTGIVIATLDGGRSEIQAYGAILDAESPFEIGSISKTFTATLFADMVLRHEVKPQDRIDRYLPPGTVAPKFGGRPITLLDLATQTSGLPRMPTNFAPAKMDDPYVDYDDAKLLAFLTSYKLTRAPGATFEYSNLGFGLLGYLLARRLHMDYATAIRTRILRPLGMKHTDLEIAGHPVETVKGHDADGDPASNWNQAVLAGAGAIVSTPHDMLRFAQANLEFSGTLGAAMRLAQHPVRAAGQDRIGYAWISRPDGIVWHNGGTAGFRSFLGLDRKHRRAIVLLANGFINAVDALGFNALDPSSPIPPAPAADVEVPADVLARYVGRYRFKDGSTGSVTRDERGLQVSFDAPPFHARLHATSSTTFVIRFPHIDVSFLGSGPQTKLMVAQPGLPADTGTRLRD